MFRLVFSDDSSGAVRQFSLTLGQHLRLGRAADNDLVVPWPQVSQHHATVEVRADCIWLEDLGSSHGLMVADRRCDRLRLGPGTDVWIGTHRLSLEEIDEVDATVALSSLAAGPVTLAGDSADGSATADAPPGSSTAQAALRWLRGFSAGSHDRRRFLLRASDILGASGLAFGTVRNGQFLVENMVGWVEPGLVEDLAPGRGEVPPDVAWELDAAANDAFAVARFVEERPVEAWKRHFLVLVGRALISTEGQTSTKQQECDEAEPLPLPAGMISGCSPQIRLAYERVRRIAPSDLSVLLLGPTGAGKELFARLVHDWGPRKGGPFQPIQTTAVPESLMEAELFGIEEGVATDVSKRQGLALAAEGGTLFLDEIGDLSLRLQAKLLRMLQEKEVWPVGSRRPLPIDVRIVAATHRDLESMMTEGTFREDLYHRLAEMCVRVPALAERRQDIPELALAFLEASRGDKRIPGFTAGALELLVSNPWRGNVRELRAAVRGAVVLARDGEMLDRGFFVDLLGGRNAPSVGPATVGAVDVEDSARMKSRTLETRTLKEQLEPVEHQAIIQALEHTQGNISSAARVLDLSRQGLKNLMDRHGVDRRQFEPKG